MIKKSKSIKKLVLGIGLSALLALPSFSLAKTRIKNVKPSNITRGEQKVFEINATNFKNGDWSAVIFAPKGQNITKSTDDALWINKVYTNTNVVTGTLWPNACQAPGNYDVYFANSSYDYDTEESIIKVIAKKKNALLVKKGKKEAKISKVSPKKLKKGKTTTVTFKGKRLQYVTWGDISKHKKGESIWGVDIEFGSIITSTNQVMMNLTVLTDTVKGFRDVELFGLNGQTEVCAFKKNAVKVTK